jgi:hypothetical protein
MNKNVYLVVHSRPGKDRINIRILNTTYYVMRQDVIQWVRRQITLHLSGKPLAFTSKLGKRSIPDAIPVSWKDVARVIRAIPFDADNLNNNRGYLSSLAQEILEPFFKEDKTIPRPRPLPVLHKAMTQGRWNAIKDVDDTVFIIGSISGIDLMVRAMHSHVKTPRVPLGMKDLINRYVHEIFDQITLTNHAGRGHIFFNNNIAAQLTRVTYAQRVALLKKYRSTFARAPDTYPENRVWNSPSRRKRIVDALHNETYMSGAGSAWNIDECIQNVFPEAVEICLLHKNWAALWGNKEKKYVSTAKMIVSPAHEMYGRTKEQLNNDRVALYKILRTRIPFTRIFSANVIWNIGRAFIGTQWTKPEGLTTAGAAALIKACIDDLGGPNARGFDGTFVSRERHVGGTFRNTYLKYVNNQKKKNIPNFNRWIPLNNNNRSKYTMFTWVLLILQKAPTEVVMDVTRYMLQQGGDVTRGRPCPLDIKTDPNVRRLLTKHMFQGVSLGANVAPVDPITMEPVPLERAHILAPDLTNKKIRVVYDRSTLHNIKPTLYKGFHGRHVGETRLSPMTRQPFSHTQNIIPIFTLLNKKDRNRYERAYNARVAPMTSASKKRKRS